MCVSVKHHLTRKREENLAQAEKILRQLVPTSVHIARYHIMAHLGVSRTTAMDYIYTLIAQKKFVLQDGIIREASGHE